MANIMQWPWAINQPGYDYPAELVRAEHHDATSGGNGVGTPTALKVQAQPAPDGTVSILPGGATVKSTYAGADGQSYHARNFQPYTLTVPPSGSSSGGRTDLVVLRVCDPQYDSHPEHGGGEISAEDAANLDFWWLELLQGQNRNTSLSYPHVKLAEIVRPANTTVVHDAHITDLRELADPKMKPFLGIYRPSATQDFTTGYAEIGRVSFEVPDFATKAHVVAHYSSMAIVNNGIPGDASGNVNGWFLGQEMGRSAWRGSTRHSGSSGNVESMTANTFHIPENRRGRVGDYVFTANQESGGTPKGRVDVTTALVVEIQFEQDVA